MRVIYNGIDVDAWHPVEDPALLAELGIDPAKPSVVFVGRITRQKGLPYFLRAAELLPADVQVILCAGAPDTPQIMAEVEGLVRGLQETREGVVWIDRMLSRHELCTVLTAATTFVCPSIYEPLGIVNLEAMACGAAVVGHRDRRHPRGRRRRRDRPARADRAGAGRHRDADRPRSATSADLARVLTEVVSDPERARGVRRGGSASAPRTTSAGRRSPTQTAALYAEVAADRPIG